MLFEFFFYISINKGSFVYIEVVYYNYFQVFEIIIIYSYMQVKRMYIYSYFIDINVYVYY